MKCPKCGKELIIRDEKVSVDENGAPVCNQFAVCMDCKKKWNLDKQRAKKAAEKKAAEAKPVPEKQETEAELSGFAAHRKAAELARAEKAPADTVSAKKPEQTEAEPDTVPTTKPVKKKAPARPDAAAEPKPVKKKPPVRPETLAESAPEARPVKKKAPEKQTGTKTVRPEGKPEARPVKRKAPADTGAIPAKKKPAVSQQTYSNIPPKEIRDKKEAQVRKSYDDMLSVEEDEPKHSKIPVIIMTILIVLALAAAGTIFFCKATGRAIPFISLSRTEQTTAEELSAAALPEELQEIDFSDRTV